LQELVRDGQPRRFSKFIADPNNQKSGLPVIGQIVGKGTDGLGEFVGVACRRCALDAIGLQIVQEGFGLIKVEHSVWGAVCATPL
jgi:hypothetical protein